MTQNLPDNSENFDISPDEGIHSILTLLNLIPDPTIIFHREQDNILAANNAFFLLTNFGENDFIHQTIKTILPDISDTDPISGHDKKALLRHKKLPSIPVTLRIFPLTQTEETLIIILKPEDNKPFSRSQAIEQITILDNLTNLIQPTNEQNIDQLIELILHQSATILNAPFVCLYKATGSTLPIVQHVTNDSVLADEFPHQLTNVDLTIHKDAEIWTTETAQQSSLQQAAAQAGYQFIVSVPLQTNNSTYGLLIAGSRTSPHQPYTISLAKLIGRYITSMVENHQHQQNLRNLNNKVKQVVRIQNEIITNLDEGVIILAPDLTIAEINPAAETILGYANIEALRQPVDSILIGSESLSAAFRSAQQGIPTMTGGDLTIHHRTGRSFPAQIMVAPVMNNGQLFSIIILIRDLSQQEQSQAANKQLEQRAILGEVTAIFAHEVRNPINAIMLSLQVIEDNLTEDDPNHKWIDNMRDECNKLMYLMESVLSFAKPLEYKMAGVDMNFLLTRILERWHPRLMRLNITSYYESSVENPIIEGDFRALEQVFTNLISNSVNAMSEEGGSLGIKITEPDDEQDKNFIQIIQTDTGHGIPDEIKAHMFKPFVTGSKQGTGLGLAITQRIINAHKGKIEVDSYPGGTIFRIFLAKKKGLDNQ